jgi:hypothetical protein
VELRSVKYQVALLGPQGYLLESTIESGKDPVHGVPQNGNVSIPVPNPSGSQTLR